MINSLHIDAFAEFAVGTVQYLECARFACFLENGVETRKIIWEVVPQRNTFDVPLQEPFVFL